jgi:outer membrane usher protein
MMAVGNARAATRSPCAAIDAALSTGLAFNAAAAPVEFSEGFLIGGESIDMGRYANGNPIRCRLATTQWMCM